MPSKKEKPKTLNFTPHDIHIYSKEIDKKGERQLLKKIEKSGTEIRLVSDANDEKEYMIKCGDVQIPVVKNQEFKGVSGLEQLNGQEKGTKFIVSLLTADYILKNDKIPEGLRMFTPDSSKGSVRNEKGELIGVTRLIEYKVLKV